MKEKMVSIIIPNYNCEKYICECLDSIYNQNYKNFEVIIIDDGSNDKSVSIIKQYIKEKENARLIIQPNMNASVARNRGIEKSKGEYLYFLDSDDVILKNGLKVLVDNIEKYNVDMAIGNYYEIDDRHNNTSNVKMKEYGILKEPILIANNSPVPSNKLYRRSIIEKYNIFFANVNIGQDLNFFLKYLLWCDGVIRIDEDIYEHRVVENGMTKGVSFKIFDITKVFDDVLKFYRKYKKEDLYFKYIEKVKFKHMFWQMNKHIKIDDYKMKKIIVNYFCYNIDKANLENIKNDENLKRDFRVYMFNRTFKTFTCSRFYSYLFKKALNKKNIKF